tara:strand:+ start:2503 stop:2937 length:435 start_codon:yes stop_codon:yes gene_type:complete
LVGTESRIIVNWPIGLRYEQKYYRYKKASNLFGSNTIVSIFFYPEIKYTYSFNGAKHTSFSVAPHIRNVWLCETGDWGQPLDNKSKFWHGWQVGTSINVFININNPAESYVINQQSKSHQSHNYAILVGGFILFLSGVLLAIYI